MSILIPKNLRYLCFIIFFLFIPGLFKVVYAQVIKAENDTLKITASSEGYNLDVVLLKKSDAKKKLPVIIYLVGSGEQSSMKTNRSLMQFFFEKTFLQNDFAVVYFDKRGIGNSEGIWYKTTFEQRALDAKNVALKLQELDFVDKDKVYIIGHSQGGWIVQIALAMYPEIFAGGVSMAGPTFGVKKQLLNDYKSDFLCNGLEKNKALKKAQRKVNRDLFFISLLGLKGNLKQLNIIKKFEPEIYLNAIQRPFLMLFAENDNLVSPTWSLEELDRIFPQGLPTNMDYYVAQGENHSFKMAPKCYKGLSRDLNFSEKTKDVIFEWVNARLIED